jgi:hypothetical protein
VILIRHKTIPTRVVRAVSYGLVIATLLGLALWGFYKHRVTPGRVEAPPPKGGESQDVAGLERRLILATDQELLAPAAFPWSLAGVSRLPRAEVSGVTLIRTPEDGELPEGLGDALAAELAEQVPAIARPFTLEASPPYLVTPLTLQLEFILNEDGATAAAAVAGAPGDLNAPFAERAARLVFSPAAANVNFTATVTLIPDSYDRLTATRAGIPVADEEYRALFRALQYNSFPFYDTLLAVTPDLIKTEDGTAVSFVVDAAGHPGAVALEPSPAEEDAAALADTLAAMHLPTTLAGVAVRFTINPG